MSKSRRIARIALAVMALVLLAYPATYSALRLSKHLVRREYYQGYGPSGPLLQYFEESEIGHWRAGPHDTRTDLQIAKHDERMRRVFSPLMAAELWLRGLDELGANQDYDGS